MRLYFAGAEGCVNDLHEAGCERMLISMANGLKAIHKVPGIFEDDEYDLLIDSGAFTYQKKGGIDLDKWIGSALEFKMPRKLIALDVIGSAEESHSNYIETIKTIPDVIPTLHLEEDLSWLKKYLEHTDYVCLGGMVSFKASPEAFAEHLKKIFGLFSRESLPKFHALGCFNQDILEMFPFYSCDATTWHNYARFGEFHRFNNTKYIRMKSPKVEVPKILGAPLDDIHLYINDDPKLKLKANTEALKQFEKYLTELWRHKNIEWK